MEALDRRTALLKEIGDMARAEGDPTQVLSDLVKKWVGCLGGEAGALWSVNETTGRFIFEAGHWLHLSVEETGRRLDILGAALVPLTEGVLGRLYASGETRVLAGLAVDGPGRRGLPEGLREGLRDGVLAPLALDGVCRGVLGVFNKIAGEFGTADADLARVLSGSAALALEIQRRRALGPLASPLPSPLAREVDSLRTRLEEIEAQKEEIAKRFEEERKAREETVRLVQEKEKEKDDFIQRHSAYEKEREVLSQRLDLTAKEKSDLSRRTAELEKSREAAERRAEHLARENDGWKAKTEALEAEKADLLRRAAAVGEDRAALENLKTEGERTRRESAETKGALERRLAGVEAEKEALAARLAGASENLAEAQAGTDVSAAEINELREKLDASRKVIEKADRRVSELSAELEQLKRTPPGGGPDAGDGGPLAAAARGPAGLSPVLQLLRALEPISYSLSSDVILKNLLEMAVRLLRAEAGQVFLKDEADPGRLRGAWATEGSPAGETRGEGLAGAVFKSREAVVAPDVSKDRRFSRAVDETSSLRARSVIAVPLEREGRLLGVLELMNRSGEGGFSPSDAHMLSVLATAGALGLEKASLLRETRESLRPVLAAVSDAVESRSSRALGRAERLRQRAVALAEALNMTDRDVRDLDFAALLSNIGKVALPAGVGETGAALSPEDEERLLRHPVIGADILGPLRDLGGAARVVRHQMERWDGDGVPDRLKGEEIPLGSRVLAVVEAFESLLTEHPPRRAVPAEVAVKELLSLSGKRFDPLCVEMFARLHRAGRFKG
jgi:HD-GYP domain-containing protein (c-di-GMP phosphodiesterase class II)